MWSYLKAWCNNEHITLGSILSDVYKVVTQLEAHLPRLQAMIDKKSEQLAIVKTQLDAHADEFVATSNALNAFKGLLGKVD